MKPLINLTPREKAMTQDLMDCADCMDGWAHDLTLGKIEISTSMRAAASTIRRELIRKGVVDIESPCRSKKPVKKESKPVAKAAVKKSVKPL